jgi:hypothetical protein
VYPKRERARKRSARMILAAVSIADAMAWPKNLWITSIVYTNNSLNILNMF